MMVTVLGDGPGPKIDRTPDLPALNVVGAAASYGVDAHEAHTTDEVIKLVESGIVDRERPTLINARTILSTPKSLAPCGIEHPRKPIFAHGIRQHCLHNATCVSAADPD